MGSPRGADGQPVMQLVMVTKMQCARSSITHLGTQIFFFRIHTPQPQLRLQHRRRFPIGPSFFFLFAGAGNIWNSRPIGQRTGYPILFRDPYLPAPPLPSPPPLLLPPLANPLFLQFSNIGGRAGDGGEEGGGQSFYVW